MVLPKVDLCTDPRSWWSSLLLRARASTSQQFFSLYHFPISSCFYVPSFQLCVCVLLKPFMFSNMSWRVCRLFLFVIIYIRQDGGEWKPDFSKEKSVKHNLPITKHYTGGSKIRTILGTIGRDHKTNAHAKSYVTNKRRRGKKKRRWLTSSRIKGANPSLRLAFASFFSFFFLLY